MKITRRDSLGLIAGGAALIRGASTRADETGKSAASSISAPGESSWASFRNGPAQLGVSKSKLSANPKKKWEFVSKDGWVGTCAIVGDHVYAPALHGYLHCLDLETGKELWKYRSIESTDPKKFAPGFKAAPLVSESAVFVGDEDGILHAVDRTNGEGLWKSAADAEVAGVASYGDQILMASHDAFLYSLKPDGTENWKFETNDRINGSPAVVEHFTFVSGCDSHLRVIDLKSGEEVRNVPLESQLIASPAVVDEILYVGSHGGDVAAINWKTGEIKWQYRGERDLPYFASAAVSRDIVLIGGHDKLMHAINRENGESLWTFATKARIESSAAVVDERVFFGSGDKNIYGLSIADGSEVWKFNAGKAISAGIAIGEGCLVVGEDDTNGKLYCFA